MKLILTLIVMLAAVAAQAQSTGGGSSGSVPGPKLKWYAGAENPLPGDVAPGTQRHPVLQMTIERYASATGPTTLTRFGANILGNLGISYVDLVELWLDVNGDGLADAGDVLIGQSYDGNFIGPWMSPMIATNR
jgi:hypothetical protein